MAPAKTKAQAPVATTPAAPAAPVKVTVTGRVGGNYKFDSGFKYVNSKGESKTASVCRFNLQDEAGNWYNCSIWALSAAQMNLMLATRSVGQVVIVQLTGEASTWTDTQGNERNQFKADSFVAI